jgi:hypothetical protein
MMDEMVKLRVAQAKLRPSEIKRPPEMIPGKVLQETQREAEAIIAAGSKARDRVIDQNLDKVVSKDVFEANMESVLIEKRILKGGEIDAENFSGKGDATQTAKAKQLASEYLRIREKEEITLADLRTFEDLTSSAMDSMKSKNIASKTPAYAMAATMKARVQEMMDDVIGNQFQDLSQSGAGSVSYRQMNKDLSDLIELNNQLKSNAGIKTRADEVKTDRAMSRDEMQAMSDEATALGQYLKGMKKEGNAKIMQDVNRMMVIAKKYGIVEDPTMVNDLIAHLNYMDEVMPPSTSSLGTKAKMIEDAPNVALNIGKRALQGAVGGGVGLGASTGGAMAIPGAIAGGLVGAGAEIGKTIFAKEPIEMLKSVSKLTGERLKYLEKEAKKSGLGNEYNRYKETPYVNPDTVEGPSSAPGDVDTGMGGDMTTDMVDTKKKPTATKKTGMKRKIAKKAAKNIPMQDQQDENTSIL